MPTTSKVCHKERYVPFLAPLARKKLVYDRWDADELVNQVVPLNFHSGRRPHMPVDFFILELN